MKIVLEEELFFCENKITQREEKCKPFLEKNGGEWRCRIGGAGRNNAGIWRTAQRGVGKTVKKRNFQSRYLQNPSRAVIIAYRFSGENRNIHIKM